MSSLTLPHEEPHRVLWLQSFSNTKRKLKSVWRCFRRWTIRTSKGDIGNDLARRLLTMSISNFHFKQPFGTCDSKGIACLVNFCNEDQGQ
jgi:hypothetical protein